MTYKILAAAILAFVVAGCGQNGPLYMPDNPSKIEQPPLTTESKAEEDAEKNGNTVKD